MRRCHSGVVKFIGVVIFYVLVQGVHLLKKVVFLVVFPYFAMLVSELQINCNQLENTTLPQFMWVGILELSLSSMVCHIFLFSKKDILAFELES